MAKNNWLLIMGIILGIVLLTQLVPQLGIFGPQATYTSTSKEWLLAKCAADGAGVLYLENSAESLYCLYTTKTPLGRYCSGSFVQDCGVGGEDEGSTTGCISGQTQTRDCMISGCPGTETGTCKTDGTGYTWSACIMNDKSCGVACKAENSWCTSDAQCCSGLTCQAWPIGAAAQTLECHPPTTPSEPTPTCKAENSWCTSDAQCCSGLTCQAWPIGAVAQTLECHPPTTPSEPTTEGCVVSSAWELLLTTGGSTESSYWGLVDSTSNKCQPEGCNYYKVSSLLGGRTSELKCCEGLTVVDKTHQNLIPGILRIDTGVCEKSTGFCSWFTFLKDALPDNAKEYSCTIGTVILFIFLIVLLRGFTR